MILWEIFWVYENPLHQWNYSPPCLSSFSLCSLWCIFIIFPYTFTYYIVSLLFVMYFYYSSMYIYILHCLALSLSNQVKEHINKYYVGAYSINNITRGFISHRGGYPFISILNHDIQSKWHHHCKWHNLKYKGCLVMGTYNNRLWPSSM